MDRFLLPLGIFLLSIFGFEIAYKSELLNTALIPAPSQIVAVFQEIPQDLLLALKETALNSLLGFFSSAVVGILLAFIFSLSSPLKKSILPFSVFFQTVPIIAIAPLLVIYFGFGGTTVVASAFIVSIFPIIANTLMGLDSYSKKQAELFAIYQSPRWMKLFKLQWPSAYPYIYSGLKVSAGLSLVGVIAGEFVAGGGLGALIDSARTQQRVDIVFSCLLLLSLLGLFYLGSLAMLDRWILKRRPLRSLS